MFVRTLGGLVLTVIMAAASAQVQLYRWIDADGTVQYSDQPPPPNVRDVQQMQVSSRPGEQPWPYQLQQAARNFPVSLFVSDCGEGCNQARQLLSKRGIPYTEFDATDAAFQDQLKKLTDGELVVPVLTVGKNVLRGFEAGQWNTELDAAGYPGSALIKISPTKATPPATQTAKQLAPAAPADGEQQATDAEVENGN